MGEEDNEVWERAMAQTAREANIKAKMPAELLPFYDDVKKKRKAINGAVRRNAMVDAPTQAYFDAVIELNRKAKELDFNLAQLLED